MQTKPDSLLVKFGGKTGEGIDSTGEMLGYIAKESGLHVNTFRTFPPVIVGGRTAYEIHMAARPVFARGDHVHLLIAFDQDSMDLLIGETAEGALVLYDADQVEEIPSPGHGVQLVDVPLQKMAKDLGNPIVRNMIALGIVIKQLGLSLDVAKRVITEKFGSKGEKVVQLNHRAVEAGYQYEDSRLGRSFQFDVPKDQTQSLLFLSGNEAMAFGALAADCKVFAGYPITPASDIMEWLAKYLPAFGGKLIQMEDEIGALCAVIGANYAGVRAMTATSGPGISLMTEALGLAGMTETPAVIIDAQRPGPSAGQPTKHEQSDVKHLIYGSHGEFPRIVIAPGTVQESFEAIVAAFNMADKYQCPVLIASDQDLALRKQTVPEEAFDLKKVKIDRGKMADPAQAENYKRYLATEDGISPRAFPGQAGLIFLASGDEHDEDGSIDVDLPEVRAKMVEKRMRKLEKMSGEDFEPIKVHGHSSARYVIVGMGSTTGPILEVLARRPELTYLQIRRLWPFPSDEVEPILAASEKIMVVEHNYQGQLAQLIRSEVNLDVRNRLHSITKYDGTPFRPAELLKEVEGCLAIRTS